MLLLVSIWIVSLWFASFISYIILKMKKKKILDNNLLLNKKSLGSVYINPNFLSLFVLFCFKNRITQVFNNNKKNSWWDEACEAWGINIDRSRDLIWMATVWLAHKQEYDDFIANMEFRWAGETASAEERYEALSWLAKMVRAFQGILSGQFSNPYDKTAFKAKLYKNIDPETAKDIIVATHCPNCAMHKIITQANSMCIFFGEVMILIRISWRLRITADNAEISSPLQFLYSTPVILPVY